MKTFASDNYSGVHPNIINALIEANKNHQVSYGDDEITAKADNLFKDIFGDVEIFYCFNGTGANIVSLKCSLLPFQSVICPDTAHIYVDECGGPTQQTGSTIIPIPTKNGKLTPRLIEPELAHLGFVHHTQPKVISISQTTELGTLYSLEEIQTLAEFAHKNKMYLHMDGARITNATAALGCSLKNATVECGVDIMSFGGTKNGMMMGDAVLIFNKKLRENAAFFHKQTAQLFSKNRFIACQFTAFLENDLWKELASHSNSMAKLLESKLLKIPEVTITQKVDANALFVIIPTEVVEPLRAVYPFYNWDEETGELRWMCSWDTTEDDIESFINTLKELLLLLKK